MLSSLAQMRGARDLTRRLLFTVAMFAVFRLGSQLPTPGVDATTVASALQSGQIFGFLNLFSGGAFFRFSVFALGIMPYINASIILQLLTQVVPRLEELSKEGTEGQKRITAYTRYATVLLALVQSSGLAFLALPRIGAFTQTGISEQILVVIVLTAGATFLMWVGELINEYGVGNGISLLIFAGIVAGFPSQIGSIATLAVSGAIPVPNLILLVILGIGIIALVIWMQEAERRIPIQYPKRMVGRRLMGGQTSYLPMKINPAGVIPVIFAISILILPLTLAAYWPNSVTKAIATTVGFTSPWNAPLQFLLVVAFTFFYAGYVFKPTDVADNLRKAGGFIPGIRPGRPTSQYLERISLRLTSVGSIFLGFVAVLPLLVVSATAIPNAQFGGTSLLIVVGVALDTMKQIQSQMVMRQYQGFLR
jgi:preprotein translocase subunit SecY